LSIWFNVSLSISKAISETMFPARLLTGAKLPKVNIMNTFIRTKADKVKTTNIQVIYRYVVYPSE